MPTQVPYTGTQEVSPQERDLAPVHIDTPVAAFGGAVAGAITHMGEVAEGAGKELFARAYAMQEMDQFSQADAAGADAIDKMTRRTLDYSQLKGPERAAGFDQYLQDITKIREDGGADLKSPYAKQQYLRDTRRYQSSMIMHGGTLAKQGLDEATTQSGLAKIDSIGNALAVINTTDGPALEHGLADIKAKATQFVYEKTGFAPGSVDNDNQAGKLLSTQIAKVAVARSNNNPGDGQDFAKKMFDRKLLNPEDYDRISKQLDAAVLSRGAAQVARKVVGEAKPDATEQDLSDAARKEAEKRFPNNPDAVENARLKTLQRRNLDESVVNKTNLDLRTSVLQAIDGHDTDGKVPTSMDEVQQSQPDVYAKYIKLDPPSRNTVDKIILHNLQIGGVEHNTKGDMLYAHQMQIVANRDTASSEDLQSVAGMNLLSSDFAILTRQQRKDLMEGQAKVVNNIVQNPNMTHALHLGSVEQLLKDAGIDKASNPEQYDKFINAYHDAVVNYGLGAGRSVKNDEELTGIAQGLINKQANTHWLGAWRGYNTKQPYAGLAEFSPQAKKVGEAAFLKQYQRSADPSSEADMELVNRLALQTIYQGMGKQANPPAPKSTNRVQP